MWKCCQILFQLQNNTSILNQSFLLPFHPTHLLLYTAFSLRFQERNLKETYNSFQLVTFSQLETALLMHMSGWACCIIIRRMPFNACAWFLILPLWLCNSLLKCSLFTWLSNTISSQLNKSSSNHSTRKEFTWMLLAHTKRAHSSFKAFYLISQLPVSILSLGLHMLWQGLRNFLPSFHVLQPCTLTRSRFAWSRHLFFSNFRFVMSTLFKLRFPLVNLTGPKSCQSQLCVCLLNPLSLPLFFQASAWTAKATPKDPAVKSAGIISTGSLVLLWQSPASPAPAPASPPQAAVSSVSPSHMHVRLV